MDNVTEIKMKYRKEQWRQRILDCQASGLSVSAWCKQNGLGQSTYYKWLHRIRAEVCQTLPEPKSVATVPFVQICSDKDSNADPDPVTVLKPATSEAAIHIRIKRADITIADGTNAQTIRATLLALKALC